MLYLFGIGINLFIILLLASKKDKILADKLLLIWLIIICTHLLLFVGVISMPEKFYASVFPFASLLPLLHGPMLYLYTAAMTNMLPANRRVWMLHFLPFAVIFLSMIPFCLLPLQGKIDVINAKATGFEFQMGVIEYAILLSGILYVTLLVFLLHKHKKNIANQFSYDEKIKLDWLRYLIYGLGAVWCIVIAQTVNAKSYDNYIFAAVVMIVVLIGYFGIRQGRIYNSIIVLHSESDITSSHSDKTFTTKSGELIIEREIEKETPAYDLEKSSHILEKKKYANSGLSQIASEKLYDQLKELMQNEKMYTDPELTLVSLAEKLNTHPNYVSQVINGREGKSFYDYINTLRVEEFKQMVLIPGNRRFTMMSLATSCGFNSKSSFNKNFKRVVGQSPSEYLNNNVED